MAFPRRKKTCPDLNSIKLNMEIKKEYTSNMDFIPAMNRYKNELLNAVDEYRMAEEGVPIIY
jgi:hypothetical protein